MIRQAIGIDLGCTNIKAVLIGEDGTIIDQRREETREHDNLHWKEIVRRMIGDLERSAPQGVDAIGLCAPGLADAGNTCIACMPGRLPGLENFNWSEFTRRTIAVLNDAHAAITAEAAFGAGRGMRHLVLITLGSGVGGGILIDGKLYQGMGQMAGHIGHVTVDANAYLRDVTNMPGSIEDAIGNITVAQRSYGRYKTTLDLIEDYRRGDILATWLWLDSVRKLAICLASTINLLSPEAIIIGGGIGQAGEALMKPLGEFLGQYEWRPGSKRTALLSARFSDMAGAIGAAAFAFKPTEK